MPKLEWQYLAWVWTWAALNFAVTLDFDLPSFFQMELWKATWRFRIFSQIPSDSFKITFNYPNLQFLISWRFWQIEWEEISCFNSFLYSWPNPVIFYQSREIEIIIACRLLQVGLKMVANFTIENKYIYISAIIVHWESQKFFSLKKGLQNWCNKFALL